MGMFDTVWVPCPSCDNEMAFQSKGGTCLLEHYPSYRVPRAVADALLSPYHYAKDAYGAVTCEHCHEESYLVVLPTLATQYVVVQAFKISISGKKTREQYE